MNDVLTSLADTARRAAENSHVPYSRKPAGLSLLLPDGSAVSGTRLENASYPLTIPAWQAAWTRARLTTSEPPFAVAATHALSPIFIALLEEETGEQWQSISDHVAKRDGVVLPSVSRLTDSGNVSTDSDETGLRLALKAAEHAVTPVSHFPVGCVAVTTSGNTATGSNVESVHDWTRGLCAERIALATARLNGLDEIETLYLACPILPGATPCGACRQVISELAPKARVVVWKGNGVASIRFEPNQLLPGAFDSEALR